MTTTDERGERGIDGPLAGLYDVFVDWPGRLSREMPGLTASLTAAGARRVLDAGCATGRHVRALGDAGFDAHGADVSDAMLSKARELVSPERLHVWRMGEAPSAELSAAAPFDAITCLGNVWVSLATEREIAATLATFQRLLAPGGLILMGLKAVAIRRETSSPYIPLLKRRTDDGEALFFVRFVDFAIDAGDDLCDFHMTVLKGDAASEHKEAVLHNSWRWRVWSPATLERCFRAAGFDAKVSASLGDPDAPPKTEDVFVHATTPR